MLPSDDPGRSAHHLHRPRKPRAHLTPTLRLHTDSLVGAPPATDRDSSSTRDPSSVDEEFLTSAREHQQQFARTAHRRRPHAAPGSHQQGESRADAPFSEPAASAHVPQLTPIDYSAPPVLQALSESLNLSVEFRSSTTAAKKAPSTEMKQQQQQQQPEQQEMKHPEAKRPPAETSVVHSTPIDLTLSAPDEQEENKDAMESESESEDDGSDTWPVSGECAAARRIL
jgi:hypothetical protein